MIRSSAQLTLGPETRRLMREVFEANEPPESAVILRMANVRERRRLAQREERVRKRYAFAGALAALCISGTALGVGVSTGALQIEFFPAVTEERSHDASDASDLRAPVPRASQFDPREEILPQENYSPKVQSSEPSLALKVPRETAERPAAGTSSAPKRQTENDVSGVPPNGATPSAANWQEVAGAMRAGEDDRAREAITPLTESLDRETRDSAELVKLRIELGSHREGKLSASTSQRARLERLAVDGASPSIRVSARRLLERVNPAGVRDFSEIDNPPQ